jgi:hypothetical protein
MLRFIVAAPFLLHGVAHLSGFLASWTASEAGFSDKPWILSPGITLGSGLGRVFGLLWLVAAIGLVGTALGIALRQSWWPTLAITASVVSLVVIVPWWNTVPPGAKFGAFFDVLTIAALLLPFGAKLVELTR